MVRFTAWSAVAAMAFAIVPCAHGQKLKDFNAEAVVGYVTDVEIVVNGDENVNAKALRVCTAKLSERLGNIGVTIRPPTTPPTYPQIALMLHEEIVSIPPVSSYGCNTNFTPAGTKEVISALMNLWMAYPISTGAKEPPGYWVASPFSRLASENGDRTYGEVCDALAKDFVDSWRGHRPKP